MTKFDDWLAFRKTGLGASEIAAVLHADIWKSPSEVWADKLDLASYEYLLNQDEYWGQKFETLIVDEYALRTGHKLKDYGRFASRRHPNYSFIFATLDREILTKRRGALECKSTDSKFDEEWEDGPPTRYIVQSQIQMAVFNLQWGVIAVLVGKSYRMFQMRRNDTFFLMTAQFCRDWWLSRVMNHRPAFHSVPYIRKAGACLKTLALTPPKQVFRPRPLRAFPPKDRAARPSL